MFTATQDFEFSASHRIDGLPEEHPCGRLHGHNYVVRVELNGKTLQHIGWLFDARSLRGFSAYIDAFLACRHLNGVVDGNPTAEAIGVYLLHVLRRTAQLPEELTARIGVSDTPKSWAWVDEA